MLTSLRTKKGRVVIACLASITLMVLWFAYKMPIAILPPLIVPFWIPIFVHQDEPVSPASRRFLLTSVALGAFMFAVGVFIYLFVVNG